jgi:hypothetical protein
MRAVRDYGQPLVEDPGWLDRVTGPGVDQGVWQHAGRARCTQFATGIVDLTPGRPPRLLDVVLGRTGKAYADWIAAREPAWRDRIAVAALDRFRGYAARHEALVIRVGYKDPPPGCRSSPVKLRAVGSVEVHRLGGKQP